MSVILETTIGDLVVDLFTEERPRACLNFLKLCKVKFYNFSLFHFVQRNFLAQTGDPTGSGRGGESIFRALYGDQAKFFEAEIKPRIKHVKKGTVSMVNNGNDMHGSQFFITLGENLDYLDGQHTVFGEVAEGFEILDKLNEAICDEAHHPFQDIRITHTVILDDPFDDPDGLKVPDRSPEPTKEQLDSGRIGADEEIDNTKGKTAEEVEEMIEKQELNAGTQILEMVGDIPDADIKPPENVLFVCKLNPVTTDEDMEIIFSRFGPIKCCEIIKDSVSQESLQYAFIEYEKVEDCERAYFKMDNVLIDDRRIHVDFSQSVAKLVYSKPGSKPVYELKDKNETKPKLKIKDTSRKEKYDLVFEGNDNDSGSDSRKKSAPSKYSKEKTDYKKRRRSSSDEQSPESRKHKGLESGGKNHGNQRRDDEERRYSASERRGKERDTRDDKRENRREHGDHRERTRDKDGGAKKHERNRYSDEGESRGKDGHSGKRGDRERSTQDRHRRNDRDVTRSKGTRRDIDDKYSRDIEDKRRDEGGYGRKEKTREGSSERSLKQRKDSDSGDNRGHQRKKENTGKTKTTRDSEASDNESGSEDEHRRRKRNKYKKDKKKKRNHKDSSSSDS